MKKRIEECDIFLEIRMNVWPTPNYLKLMGNKLELIWHLDSIARILGSPRPNTVIWRKGDPMPKNAVLKRTHSDQGIHILMPEEALLKLDDFTYHLIHN